MHNLYHAILEEKLQKILDLTVSRISIIENIYLGIFKLETFTEVKDFVDNQHYHKQRQEFLSRLGIDTIDGPMVEIISDLNKLPHCFTLQSCYGHFLHDNQKDPKNIEPLPVTDSITSVEYRMAYIALCIENSPIGRALFQDLRQFPAIDPKYIQFGCAQWFWRRQVNSYVLQVEPKRYMTKDKVTVDYLEALHIEKTKNGFFSELKRLTKKRIESNQPG